MMTKEEMDKYAYELMVKNNSEEAVKQLLLKDKIIEEKQQRIDKAIDFIKENADYSGISFCSDLRYDECLELLKILKGE